jgi:hypothetical protein
MDQILETNAALLLNSATGIIKRYEVQWQKTGEKYNIFTVAKIAHKEPIMCRVLADLMNPQGKHGQGSRYLELFWETISPNLPALDFEHTRVTTEYVIGEKRRIDIAFEDGKVFVPIEVKIWAGDQKKQLADYFAFAKTKNRNNHIPVLYLTVDGHEPSDFSKDGIGEKDYVKLSFKDDIMSWLESCARENENTPATTIPVRENLKQLIAAIKSLCGKSEDEKMENEIFELITKGEENYKAAKFLAEAYNSIDNKIIEIFKNKMWEMLQQRIHEECECDQEEGTWFYGIPLKEGNYMYRVYFRFTEQRIFACAKKATKIDEGKVSEILDGAPVSNRNWREWGNNTKWYSTEVPLKFGLPAEAAQINAWCEGPNPQMKNLALYKLYSEHQEAVIEKIVKNVAALNKILP